MEAEVYGEDSRTSSKAPPPRAFFTRFIMKAVKMMAPRRLEERRVFELEKQEGGHELKEKEVGEDPDSQIQHKPWPVPLEV